MEHKLQMLAGTVHYFVKPLFGGASRLVGEKAVDGQMGRPGAACSPPTSGRCRSSRTSASPSGLPTAARARACLQLVSNAFPSDIYFSDAASDAVEFGPAADDPKSLEVVVRLIEALRKCGFEGEELRQQLQRIEFPALSPEAVEKLLDPKPHA